ncbi:MAG: type 2 isopentenyl-diphosphate Delta-isomerase [Desulfurococcales archaeon]|nr:type 2 isopentenyl-diphosphate Delta-isomerase [Desulfurococcales archaeon]
MEFDLTTKDRKLDHIKITVDKNVESEASTLLEGIFVTHNSLPEVDMNEVDVSTNFLGKRIDAPIIITGMTGGHPDTAKINEYLALEAEKHGIALGVGSQRAAIEHKDLEWTFRVARKYAPNVPLVANIGASQLIKGYGIKEVLDAIQMIEADGIAIHLNPLQEVFQLEGDTEFNGILSKIIEIVDESPVPVVIKETGTGLSPEVVYVLYRLGVRYFDVSGLGGTNWAKVEVLRAKARGNRKFAARLDGYGDFWGNPTAYSVIMARMSAPDSTIISSGGIRTGMDIVYSIVIGGDLGGFALPALRVLVKEGREGLNRFVESIIYQVKVGILLTGSRNIEELRCRKFTIKSNELRLILTNEGYDPYRYNRVKCHNKLKVPLGWM